MKTEFDEEIEVELQEQLDRSEVKVLAGDQFLRVIESAFPMGLNRIAWDKIPAKHHIRLVEYSKAPVESFLESIRGEYPELDSYTVWVIGDDAIEQTYEMPFSLFCDRFDLFLSLPQHSYVIFGESADFCLNYTFEDDLYFGRRPS